MIRAVRRCAALLLLTLACLPLAACGSGGITPIQTPFNKGVYYYTRGEFDQAISEYKGALEEDPADYRARFNLGVALEAKAAVLRETGSNDDASALTAEAEQAYLNVLKSHKDNLRAAVNLAAIRYQRGEKEAAKQDLRSAMEANPAAPLPRTALGAHLLTEGLLEEARVVLEEASGMDEGNVSSHYLLGETLRRLGEIDDAREEFKKGLVREQEDVASLVSLGTLEMKEGQLEEARSYLEFAVDVDENHEGAHAMLARLLEQQGELEGAVRHLWRVRDLSRDPARVLAAREKIRELYGLLLQKEDATKGS